MDWDLVLAAAHHLAVFTVVGIFAIEFALVRPGLSGLNIQRLGRVDIAYGVVAGLVVIIGVLRVFFGAVDESYYWGNHAFWGKMLAFVLVALLTIPPTLAIRRWFVAGKGVANYVPPHAEIVRTRRFIHAQAGLFMLIVIFAAAMARGYGS